METFSSHLPSESDCVAYLRPSHEVVTVTFFDGEAFPHRFTSRSRWSTMLLPTSAGSLILAKVGQAISNDRPTSRIFFIAFQLTGKAPAHT